MNPFFFELVTRDRCPLCKDGEDTLRRVARLMRASVRVTQVESDDALLAEYALRIPVVRDPTGNVLDEGRLDARRLFVKGWAARLR